MSKRIRNFRLYGAVCAALIAISPFATGANETVAELCKALEKPEESSIDSIKDNYKKSTELCSKHLLDSLANAIGKSDQNSKVNDLLAALATVNGIGTQTGSLSGIENANHLSNYQGINLLSKASLEIYGNLSKNSAIFSENKRYLLIVTADIIQQRITMQATLSQLNLFNDTLERNAKLIDSVLKEKNTPEVDNFSGIEVIQLLPVVLKAGISAASAFKNDLNTVAITPQISTEVISASLLSKAAKNFDIPGAGLNPGDNLMAKEYKDLIYKTQILTQKSNELRQHIADLKQRNAILAEEIVQKKAAREKVKQPKMKADLQGDILSSQRKKDKNDLRISGLTTFSTNIDQILADATASRMQLELTPSDKTESLYVKLYSIAARSLGSSSKLNGTLVIGVPQFGAHGGLLKSNWQNDRIIYENTVSLTYMLSDQNGIVIDGGIVQLHDGFLRGQKDVTTQLNEWQRKGP